MTEPRTQRFLVVHDYGMGSLWWWVWAESADQIRREVAEVDVVSDREQLHAAADWGLTEVVLDAAVSGSNNDAAAFEMLRRKRSAYRDKPGFGALVGRAPVYLRMATDDAADDTFLMEIGSDGRRIRQVRTETKARRFRSPRRFRSSVEDWLFNAPFDLYDPQYLPMEIDRQTFEAEWSKAVHDPGAG